MSTEFSHHQLCGRLYGRLCVCGCLSAYTSVRKLSESKCIKQNIHHVASYFLRMQLRLQGYGEPQDDKEKKERCQKENK